MDTPTIFAGMEGFVKEWFGPDTTNLTSIQMMVRAIVTFLIALVLIRFAGIRSFGSRSAFDIVLSITMGAVLSRCITGNYSYTACVSAAAVLALMHRLFAMIAFYSPRLSVLIKGKPHMLLENDRINWKNMKRHNLSLDDLVQAGHKMGLPSIENIALAIFETDGKITIVPKIRTQAASRINE